MYFGMAISYVISGFAWLSGIYGGLGLTEDESKIVGLVTIVTFIVGLFFLVNFLKARGHVIFFVDNRDVFWSFAVPLIPIFLIVAWVSVSAKNPDSIIHSPGTLAVFSWTILGSFALVFLKNIINNAPNPFSMIIGAAGRVIFLVGFPTLAIMLIVFFIAMAFMSLIISGTKSDMMRDSRNNGPLVQEVRRREAMAHLSKTSQDVGGESISILSRFTLLFVTFKEKGETSWFREIFHTKSKIMNAR